MLDIIPDLPHIERIRNALWSREEYGRAAVFVGAGFSRNAVPRFAARPFPLWKELSDQFVDRLYPPHAVGDGRDIALQQANSTSGALRLAQEFQVAFGRDALDAVLATAIPDLEYLPGDLHRRLLELPWSDVVTTNYDTLLERCAQELPERKYDVIRTYLPQ